MKKRKTEHIDFKNRFAAKLAQSGCLVYIDVPQEYFDHKLQRTIKGRIDIVSVKEKKITAYELETIGAQTKSRAKLAAFECDSAYIICHDGRSIKVK